jgi:acetolactate synthase-1/2/3 large subunit
MPDADPAESTMTTRDLKVETVAEAYLLLLKDRGIDHFFGNAGTDFASLVDAFAKFEAEGTPSPRPMVIPHEFVAVSMAHGYYVASGRPAAVMVHVNVGTGNASTAIISASRASVPIFMSAGRTPITEEGLPGARDLHIHWAQESFDQAAMLREYVKWDYELRNATQLESVVDRAFELMMVEPCGPIYLSLPREVLAAPLPSLTITSPPRRQVASERFPDPARIDEAARLLARAEFPLVLTSASGRDARAVSGLIALAEAGGIGVVEADPTYMNFPLRHDLHLGFNQSGTTNPSLGDADVILVVDADVPWYPAVQKPKPSARIIHLGIDPFFSRYPMRSYPCDVPIVAAPAIALPMLTEAIRREADRATVKARTERIAAAHRKRLGAWEAQAMAQASKSTVGFAWVAKCIEQVLDDDTVVVNEYPLDRRQVAFSQPGSYLASPHSSGLGWGLGAALGVKLARPEKTVIATVGDGAYFFSEPISCHFVQRTHDVPLLTVIFNNQRWEAVKSAAAQLHPDGWAKRTGRFPLSDLTPSPRFEDIVKAFDGHGERVESPSDVVPALKRGLAAVREGRQALVHVLCQRVP